MEKSGTSKSTMIRVKKRFYRENVHLNLSDLQFLLQIEFLKTIYIVPVVNDDQINCLLIKYDVLFCIKNCV